MAFEVGLALGGAAFNAFLAVVFDRSSKTRKLIEFFQGTNHIKLDEILDKLDTTMLAISVVLEDAEDKQRKSELVRRWLDKVKHSVTHADDLLDELNYELLRLKVDYEFQHKQTRAAPGVCLGSATAQDPQTSWASLNPAFVEKLMPNLEKVTATLEYFEKQSERLRLQKLDPKKNIREPSSSVVDKSMVDMSQFFGRDDEKKKLIEMVLHDEGASNVSVIAITGMGGIGKTTLAQLVYNDERVMKKFSTKAWVCVSEEYNAHQVTKALLMEVNSAVVDKKDSFNGLQVKLKDNLAGKCVLIILDDIWNENPNDWTSLKTPLSYGGGGSKILITTRNEKVALMMQTETFDNLQPMPHNQSWRLFEKQAFDNGHHTPLHEFVKIGEEIVKKCKGLPLAIKTVAGALRPEKGIKVWQDFLSSEDWALGGDILPALSLSYNHLKSHLKGCFAFCALFHKDVPFDKDEVVLLWMANDLVKPSTQKEGRVYFEELKSRSFFESVNGKKYLMHDLINDLARFVTKNTCIRLEDYQPPVHQGRVQRENELPPGLLHFSYLSIDDEKAERFSSLAQALNLRTFLPIHQSRYRRRSINILFFSDIVPRFQRLRALNLSEYGISMVPDSIGDLKHLRFLNLASTNIEKLPKAICKCMNLQTLILAKCERLVELPEEMILLINLQHLDVRGVGEPLIKTMASWLRMFEDIPNISIVVDKIYGNVLEHLDKLQPCHSLEIIELGDTNVVTTAGAKRVKLKDKDCIENLTLEWGSDDECSDSGYELNKFAKLEPHTNIKQLSIKGYEGTRFPDWLGDSAFSNLESLSLKDCNNCFSLPSLGQLTGLKKLEIIGMDRMKKLGNIFYGDASTSKPFQALEELEIHICNNILSFPEGGLAAPNLKVLEVNNCKKIKSLPARMRTQLPLLTQLSIVDCPEIECFPKGGLPSSLETLEIRNCSKMRICQTNWGLQTLPSLTFISFSGFEDTLFPEEGLLPTTLQILYFYGFSNLESVNEKGLQHLSCLQTLWIWDCPNLQYLPQQKFSSSLSNVYIGNCELVESFPEGLASSLSTLYITRCPKLAARIEMEKGEDWPKVSHIPTIEIDFKII